MFFGGAVLEIIHLKNHFFNPTYFFFDNFIAILYLFLNQFYLLKISSK